MDLTDVEVDMLTAAIASRRKEQGFSRRIRQESRTERQRLASAERADHERFAQNLLAPAGIDIADMERRRERNTAAVRAFLERQRRAVIDHSSVVAERQEALARGLGVGLVTDLPSPRLGAYKLITLDTASMIQDSYPNPDANESVAVQIDPPAPMHNVAKVYASEVTSPDVQFHIPGFFIVDIDYVFKLSVADDILLNAITFVQASGADSLFASGWVLSDSYAEIDFSTRLQMFVVGPPPLEQIRAIGTGDADEGPTLSVNSDWWDVLGKFESTVYDFQSTLIDKSFSSVAANSTIFIVVSAGLALSADGNAFNEADFYSGDLRINVPAVYVPTFANAPIP